jgi:CheY-like chemotaxis protein
MENRGSGRRKLAPVVLVVDDDEGCRDEVRQVLENAAYVVLVAADGEEALQLLLPDQAPVPTVILLDIWLPGMTGTEVLRIIRAHDKLARIPVILTSASHEFANVGQHATEADGSEAVRLGTLPAGSQTDAARAVSGPL